MKNHTAKGWTVEEFDAWMAASDREEAIAQAADEEGGPRLSLVPPPDRREVWPTDLLPPAADPEAPAEDERSTGDMKGTVPAGLSQPQPPVPDMKGTVPPGLSQPRNPIAATPFDGVPLEDSRKRLAGWSAARQRLFLRTLAETGQVHLACAAARLTARSAYSLRARSPAFAAAWDTADLLAVGRLSAIAFDRAISGRIEQIWQQGALVAEKRTPSDRLLMWLLARLDPRRFAAPWELRKDGAADPQAEARASFPAQLDALSDQISE